MDSEKECQLKKEEKYYQIEEEKKEKQCRCKKFTFPKKMKFKIKNFSSFKERIFHFLLIKNNFNEFHHPRIAIIIKKKYIKLAVQRNKIKRIIYETFRLKQHKIKKYDYLLIIKKNILYINKKYINKIWKKYYK